MHLASTGLGGRTPTLEVERERMSFSYTVDMIGATPACGMYSNLFEWPGVGTMQIGAEVRVMDLGGMELSDYVGSELHRNVSRVLLSLTAVA